MFYGIKQYWSRCTADYDKSALNIVCIKEGKKYEIIYEDSLISRSDCTANKIPILNIAVQFASLYKKKADIDVFSVFVIDFISKYGFMGINKVKTNSGNFKEKVPYIESILDWMNEVDEMFSIFLDLYFLQKNPPLLDLESRKIPCNNSHYEDDAYSISYGLECNKNLENDSQVKLSKVISVINKHLAKVNPYLICDFLEDKYVARPMMNTFDLLSSMYFAILQSLQSTLKYCICDTCGYPFIASYRKSSIGIIDKCDNCIKSDRSKRRNKKRRSNHVNNFRDNMQKKVKYYTTLSRAIPLSKVKIIDEWYSNFIEDLESKKFSDFDTWKESKKAEFSRTIHEIKQEAKTNGKQ